MAPPCEIYWRGAMQLPFIVHSKRDLICSAPEFGEDSSKRRDRSRCALGLTAALGVPPIVFRGTRRVCASTRLAQVPQPDRLATCRDLLPPGEALPGKGHARPWQRRVRRAVEQSVWCLRVPKVSPSPGLGLGLNTAGAVDSRLGTGSRLSTHPLGAYVRRHLEVDVSGRQGSACP